MEVSQFTAAARAEFAVGMQAAYEMPFPAKYEQFLTKFPSTAKVETHTYMSNLPRLARFKGYTPGLRLEDKVYTIPNFEWRIGAINVREADIADDQVVGYMKSIQGLVPRAIKDTGHQILSKLAAGSTDLCFDGTAMFANSHVFGSGDNLDTFDPAATDAVTHKIIALVTENPIKPVLFQDRESLSALETDAGTPQQKKVKEIEYWADCRFGLGFGFWWDSYQISISDTPTVPECYTIVEQIINGLRSFTLPKGHDVDDVLYVHEGWDPTPQNFVLCCNLKLGQILKRALAITQYITATGNVDNVYKDVATVIPTSALGA